MGKIHFTLEKEVNEIKNRMLCNLTELFVEKQITNAIIDLHNIYGLNSEEAITSVDCQNRKVIASSEDGSSMYDFKIELEIDVLLWLILQIEDNYFDLQD